MKHRFHIKSMYVKICDLHIGKKLLAHKRRAVQQFIYFINTYFTGSFKANEINNQCKTNNSIKQSKATTNKETSIMLIYTSNHS